MKYFDEFKDKKIVKKIAQKISDLNVGANIMEVCGTHTMSIFRYGIRSLLPKKIKLLTGPGCPVCVTNEADIDAMIELADIPEAIIVTFGDMIKIPGSKTSLNQKKAEGADIRIVYSPLDCLDIAAENPEKPVIFLGIGFETTTPTIAATVIKAYDQGIENFYVYSSHKTMPPPLRAVLDAKDVKINGFILPGHVSTILGTKEYEFIAKEFNVPSVVAGFEPVDIMNSIYMLLKQINNGAKIEIEYSRVVKPEGNLIAKKMVDDVFGVIDAEWRGFGIIPGSGLEFKEKYSKFNAKKVFNINPKSGAEDTKYCDCGEILRGIKSPYDCRLFGRVCTPEKPKGPCMISAEGACSVYYKYGAKK